MQSRDSAATGPCSPELLARASGVRLACFDVDGVLTDGRLWYGPDGEAIKAFDVHDGMGLRLLMEARIEVAIVTARSSSIVTARVRDLGILRVHQGIVDKLQCVRDIASELGCDLSAVAFVGDDLPDRAVMGSVGFAIAVANARPEILAGAHMCTHARGGRGAVREVCDLLIAACPRGNSESVGTDGVRA